MSRVRKVGSVNKLRPGVTISKKKIDLNLEDENILGGPFMLNRWITMYSKEMCGVVNNFLNRQYLFDDKNLDNHNDNNCDPLSPDR